MAERRAEGSSATGATGGPSNKATTDMAPKSAHPDRYPLLDGSQRQDNAGYDYDPYSIESGQDDASLDGPIDPYLATFTQRPYQPQNIPAFMEPVRTQSSTMPVPSPYPTFEPTAAKLPPQRPSDNSDHFVVPGAYSAQQSVQENPEPPHAPGSYSPLRFEIVKPTSVPTWIPSSYPNVNSTGLTLPPDNSMAAPLPRPYPVPRPKYPDNGQDFDPKTYPSNDISPEETVITFNSSTDASIIDITFARMNTVDSGTTSSNERLSFSNLALRSWNRPAFADAFRLASSSAGNGLLMVIIEGWRPWFLQDFRKELPDFPLESLLYFGAEGGPAMLPLVDNEENELSCVVEHINTNHNTELSDRDANFLDLGATKAHRQRLVLWTRKLGRATNLGYRPIVVIIGGSGNSLGAKLQQHYSDVAYKRWYRLQSDLTWSYLDTYFVLTKWDRIWSAIKENMRMRSAELQGQVPAPPILQQTRRLHQETNMIISLREHLRIHKASVRRITQGVGERAEATDPAARKLGRALRVRLDDTFQLLEYYDVTACSLLDQQQNLLSLAFNTETVSQGQSVTRLNALAFIFLPLSFSASIWGITTFTVDAIWYPAFALPLLAVTIIIAVISNTIFSMRDSKPLQNNALKSPSLQRSSFWGSMDFGKIWPKKNGRHSNIGYTSQSMNDGEEMVDQNPTWRQPAETQPKPTPAIPYGMSPAYGLGGPSSSSVKTYISPPSQTIYQLDASEAPSATANTMGPPLQKADSWKSSEFPTVLEVPVQRSSSLLSLRSRRSFSWKKGDDDLGAHSAIQEHGTNTSQPDIPPPHPQRYPVIDPAVPAITTSAPEEEIATLPSPSLETSFLNTKYPRHPNPATGRINAVPPMDHKTLETILEQSPPLARNAPSGNLAHFRDEDPRPVLEHADVAAHLDKGKGKEKRESGGDAKSKGKQTEEFEDGTGLFYSDFWAVGEIPQDAATGESVEEQEDQKRGYVDWRKTELRVTNP